MSTFEKNMLDEEDWTCCCECGEDLLLSCANQINNDPPEFLCDECKEFIEKSSKPHRIRRFIDTLKGQHIPDIKIAEILGVSRRTVFLWKTGYRIPSKHMKELLEYRIKAWYLKEKQGRKV